MLIVILMVSLALAASAAYAIPMIARESMRSALYDVQTHQQLARVAAVSRNHECRFVVNRQARLLRVVDTRGTTSTTDDVVLHEKTLAANISFARPDSGPPVTLAHFHGTEYGTRFDSDGTVIAGTGEVVLYGGEGYGRITVYGAGGVQVERWRNSAWHVGG